MWSISLLATEEALALLWRLRPTSLKWKFVQNAMLEHKGIAKYLK